MSSVDSYAMLLLAVALGSLGLAATMLVLYIRKGGQSGGLEALAPLRDGVQRLENQLREETASNRQEVAGVVREAKAETNQALGLLTESLMTRFAEHGTQQTQGLQGFGELLTRMSQNTNQQLEDLRETVDRQLKSLQANNEQKLDKMRETVEEKLQSTLDKRLSESFQQVRERLDAVHKFLGEVQTLAAGVGDLQKVLSNVKTRGTFGEVQLENLLEQFLTPDQYDRNVATVPDSNDRVEFAIRLPGRDPERDAHVHLPIDAKFPLADYERMLEAQERSDPDLLKEAAKALEKRILGEAEKIRCKYLAPPHTTDFAVLFLPSESLYAEVLRRPGLFQKLQREHQVVVAGPTTIAALLNALQVGFRTLVIEKRSSEVWELLGMVKTEFGDFEEALAKVKKKINEAGSSIDFAERRTRVMQQKLKSVESSDVPALEPADEGSEL